MRMTCRLSTLLGERRMKQAQLAKLADMRPATINQLYWDKAERILLRDLAALCAVLECSPNDLFVLDTEAPGPDGPKRVDTPEAKLKAKNRGPRKKKELTESE